MYNRYCDHTQLLRRECECDCCKMDKRNAELYEAYLNGESSEY